MEINYNSNEKLHFLSGSSHTQYSQATRAASGHHVRQCSYKRFPPLQDSAVVHPPGPSWTDCQCRPHRHVELAFHWQIMKPNLQPLMPGETFSMDSIRCHPDRETAFSIAPESGLLYPHTDHEFILGFSPHEVKMTPSRESRTIGSWHVHPLSLLLSDTEARVGPDHIPSTLPQPARGRAGLGDALPVRTRTRVLPGPDPAHTSSAPRPWAHVAALGSSMFLPHRRRRSHPRPVPSSPRESEVQVPEGEVNTAPCSLRSHVCEESAQGPLLGRCTGLPLNPAFSHLTGCPGRVCRPRAVLGSGGPFVPVPQAQPR